MGRVESELSPTYIFLKKGGQLTALISLVELPGFEPGQTEPKSVVLPLHHSSVPGGKDTTIFIFLQKIKCGTWILKNCYLCKSH